MAKGDIGMKKRTLVRAGVAAVTIAALMILASPNGAFGQSSSTPSTSPAKTVDFVEGTTADIKYTNPFTAISSSEYEILELNYDLLLQFGQKDLAVPCMRQGVRGLFCAPIWSLAGSLFSPMRVVARLFEICRRVEH